MFFFERERYYFNSSFLPLLEPLLVWHGLHIFGSVIKPDIGSLRGRKTRLDKCTNRTDPLCSGEQEHGLRVLGRIYVLDGEPRPLDGPDLHNIPDVELAQQLRGGVWHGPDEQVELEPRMRRRGDAHEGRRGPSQERGDAGQDVLPWGGVRGHEVRGTREIKGDKEDGLVLGGGSDGGDRHRCPGVPSEGSILLLLLDDAILLLRLLLLLGCEDSAGRGQGAGAATEEGDHRERRGGGGAAGRRPQEHAGGGGHCGWTVGGGRVINRLMDG